MPVISKVSMNGLAAIKKIGVENYLFDWLSDSEVQVKLTSSAFIFSYMQAGVLKQEVVPVTLTQLQKLNAGTLPAGEKDAIKKQIGDMITHLIYEAEKGELSKPEGTLAQLPPLHKVHASPEIEYLTPVDPSPNSAINSKAATKQPKLWDMYDLSKIKTDPTVQLADATMMYQPVRGTSGGSRYFVVGGNDDLRIAARYQNQTLSVRIEGPHWQKHVASIKACGFDLTNQKKNYCSIHLQVADEVLAQKTLGAVLLGLGVPLDTPVPNLKLVKS